MQRKTQKKRKRLAEPWSNLERMYLARKINKGKKTKVENEGVNAVSEKYEKSK